jgi:hypothetical protein
MLVFLFIIVAASAFTLIVALVFSLLTLAIGKFNDDFEITGPSGWRFRDLYLRYLIVAAVFSLVTFTIGWGKNGFGGYTRLTLGMIALAVAYKYVFDAEYRVAAVIGGVGGVIATALFIPFVALLVIPFVVIDNALDTSGYIRDGEMVEGMVQLADGTMLPGAMSVTDGEVVSIAVREILPPKKQCWVWELRRANQNWGVFEGVELPPPDAIPPGFSLVELTLHDQAIFPLRYCTLSPHLETRKPLGAGISIGGIALPWDSDLLPAAHPMMPLSPR